MKKWWQLIFGKWNVIERIPVTRKIRNYYFNSEIHIPGNFIIEENHKTKARRAYFESLNRDKQKVSLPYVEALKSGYYEK